MLKQTVPLALKWLQNGTKEQGTKLMNAAMFSSRAGVEGAEEVTAATEMKVSQYSSAEATALANKKKNLTGLGGLSLRPARAMNFNLDKATFSSFAMPAAATQTAVEPAKQAPSFFARMAKAVAALAAAVAMALSTTAAADSPEPFQWGFQDMATSHGQAAVDLHHDIMFFLITVTVLVLYLAFQFATKFHYSHVGPIAEKLTHHTTLEVLWTIFPTLIVLMIGIPSLTLIYSMDQQNDKPGLTVKVIGRQWYWSYEMHDHLQHKLVDPDRLVALAERSMK